MLLDIVAGMLGSYGHHVEYAAMAVVLFFFLSPCVQVRRVHRTGGEALADLNPTSLIAMYSNCALWLTYGLFYPVPPCIPPNSIGFAVCCYYLGSCWWHARERKVPTWGFRAAAATVCAMALSVLCVLYASASPKQAEHVGYIAMIVNVIMYGAPLSVIRQVLAERSSSALPPLQCGLGLLCSLLWLTVGLNNRNIPTIIPNALGAPLAVVQIFLILKFPRLRKGTDELAAKLHGSDEMPYKELAEIALADAES
eukprot:TRINITY_DN58074_c0_g1_i1.p1 TRINITY_DN58074_c0_g1~~TRINITY_DN58074_c0_g1_i1.p1  ORF type:complete len:254 (-),score=32.29 TRINITY_DN58074_c0_g1_i1:58-819(-)